MKLILGGVRGTNSVAQPDFQKYGGETTSFLVEGERGEHLLIDAGTGVRSLGQRLDQTSTTRSVLLLMTHYHLDHITGLASFAPLYSPHWSIQIASPVREGFRIEEVMPRLLDRPFWPIQIDDLESHVHFGTLDGESSRAPVQYGGFEIRWCPLPHPGGSTAYRIDEPLTGSSVVIATDMEWALATAEQQRGFLKLCREPGPVGLLLMDGQYAPDEYPQHKGWGHSTWVEGVEIARQVGAAKFLVTHHSPDNKDDRLDAIEREMKEKAPFAALAKQGMEISVTPRKDQRQQ